MKPSLYTLNYNVGVQRAGQDLWRVCPECVGASLCHLLNAPTDMADRCHCPQASYEETLMSTG